MRERGKPYGKTDSCYITEENGNPGTGIIDVTKHNHFLDLVEHVAKRKNNKAKSNNSTTGNHASALSSYPTDMIHADMNSQQVVNAFAGLVLNDATPEMVMSLEKIGSAILDDLSALESEPMVDDVTKINVELHMDSDPRYRALIDAQAAVKTLAPIINKWEGIVLSEASAQALEMFKKLKH